MEGYFFHDRPMAELAAELSVTESRVSQMRAEAIVLIRHALDAVLEPGAAVTSVPVVAVRPARDTARGPQAVDVIATALAAAAALAVPAAALAVPPAAALGLPAATRAGVVARRRAEYVTRVAGRRTPAQRLAYVADTELSQSA